MCVCTVYLLSYFRFAFDSSFEFLLYYPSLHLSYFRYPYPIPKLTKSLGVDTTCKKHSTRQVSPDLKSWVPFPCCIIRAKPTSHYPYSHIPIFLLTSKRAPYPGNLFQPCPLRTRLITVRPSFPFREAIILLYAIPVPHLDVSKQQPQTTTR